MPYSEHVPCAVLKVPRVQEKGLTCEISLWFMVLTREDLTVEPFGDEITKAALSPRLLPNGYPIAWGA